MILSDGQSSIYWVIVAIVAICIFVLAQWLIPVLFALVGVTIPDRIATILALLCALGVVWAGHRGVI